MSHQRQDSWFFAGRRFEADGISDFRRAYDRETFNDDVNIVGFTLIEVMYVIG